MLGILRACQRGIGIAMLPDYLVEENGGLVQLFGETDAVALDAYFVYPEELKIGGARAGVPRLPGVEGATLELLSARARCAPDRRFRVQKRLRAYGATASQHRLRATLMRR